MAANHRVDLPTQPSADVANGYFALIKKVMENEAISVRQLYERCRLRNRTTFMKRLKNGTLLMDETMQCLRALNIDLNRAFLAVHQLGNPDAYFDPVNETAAVMQLELARALNECHAAAVGDFEPIKQGLARSLASDLVARVTAHQERVREVRYGKQV